jgi:NAD(P)-dependent dehydrogenase (short-subunit alcohol dehydrogenase family)
LFPSSSRHTDPLNQKQRIALVTGANRGIGFEGCRQLKDKGLWVILTTRDGDQGLAQAKSLEVNFHPLDVTDQASVERLKTWVLETHGHLDVLVNNAALNHDADAADVMTHPAEMFRTTLETNTFGPLRLCQAFIPMMIVHGYGRVVNVSSGMGQLADMGNAAPAYAVSKTALNALTRIFADAARGHNVLVNAVDPGWVCTAMGGPSATRSVGEGAKGIIWAATLPDGGPTGGFFRDGQAKAW